MQQIAVLAGQGINSEPVIQSLEILKNLRPSTYCFAVEKVTAKTVCFVLEQLETVALILPGSDSSQHTRKILGTDGMECVRKFAQRAGLLGICSGGYLTGMECFYEINSFPKVYQRSSNDNLKLINADMVGPIPDYLQEYVRHHPDNPCLSWAPIKMTNSDDIIHLPYWQGGIPLLPDDQTTLRVLASFADPYDITFKGVHHYISRPIAIGVKDMDQGGKVISSAVHPEIRGSYFNRHLPYMARMHEHYRALQPIYRDLSVELTEKETVLNHVFSLVIDELLDCKKARILHKNGLAVPAATS